jgi:hypothetical protein
MHSTELGYLRCRYFTPRFQATGRKLDPPILCVRVESLQTSKTRYQMLKPTVRLRVMLPSLEDAILTCSGATGAHIHPSYRLPTR